MDFVRLSGARLLRTATHLSRRQGICGRAGSQLGRRTRIGRFLTTRTFPSILQTLMQSFDCKASALKGKERSSPPSPSRAWRSNVSAHSVFLDSRLPERLSSAGQSARPGRRGTAKLELSAPSGRRGSWSTPCAGDGSEMSPPERGSSALRRSPGKRKGLPRSHG